MSLDVYTGEFLISPIPLELSLNYCSHACPFCFANLNVRDRTADMPALLRLLAEYPQRRSLAAHWLRGKYPICFSNRVDPFATTNIRATLEIVPRLVAEGIPIQFQTRGALRPGPVEAVLDQLPLPTVWYLSIDIWDEAIRQKVTPGAPPIPRRLELVEQLVARGHHVVVGINPCVPEWLPGDHAEQLLEACYSRRVWGVWVERLHFNPQQRKAMTPRERAAIGEELIGRVIKPETAPADRAFLDRVRQAAQAIGLEIYSVGQPNASNFFAPYRACYRTIPTMQDFINDCHARRRPGELITFSEFVSFFAPRFPGGTLPIDCYLGATARQVFRTHDVPTQMPFAALFAILYQELRCKLCPARLPSFAYAAIWDGDGWIKLVDGEGMPYLVWSPTGHSDYYCHVDTAAGG